MALDVMNQRAGPGPHAVREIGVGLLIVVDTTAEPATEHAFIHEEKRVEGSPTR
jgi:hypothetical protein